MGNDHADSDEALLAAARAGRAGALNRLIDRHQQGVRTFLRRICIDPAEADDLAQETFVAAWLGLARYRAQASVRSWLCAIAWRKAKDARRAWFRRRARDGAYEARAELERADGVDAEDRLALRAALAALPLEQRAAVALCLGGEFSHGEAAAALGMPLGTVKSHVARGREKLLEGLGDDR